METAITRKIFESKEEAELEVKRQLEKIRKNVREGSVFVEYKNKFGIGSIYKSFSLRSLNYPRLFSDDFLRSNTNDFSKQLVEDNIITERQREELTEELKDLLVKNFSVDWTDKKEQIQALIVMKTKQRDEK